MDILELTAGSAALMLTAPVVSTIAQAADESASAVLKDTNARTWAPLRRAAPGHPV